ncbi:DUF481 domain-containing protein [Shewanella waksmanii]|uniref:DUF481 domain-containing protein n=1 Tax=Shewanella waksmanii TaxID=213783 RepID=UPI00048C705F|nr:DUF481 domain-containing protein [Shewanella waksmanii]
MLKKWSILALCLLAAPCAAENETTVVEPTLAEKKSKTIIRVGGFYSNSNSSMDVTDPLLGRDFQIDFEEDLKLEESQFLPFFELFYHFNDQHILYMDWKQLHRSAEVTQLTKPFQVELDGTLYDFKAGSKIDTTLNIDIARIGYGYNFYQGNNYNLGFSIGLHAMFIKTGFEGQIGACQVTTATADCPTVPVPKTVDTKVTAPLPDIGLYGDYEFADRFRFTAHAQYFYVKLDDLEGGLVDIRAGVEAEITENWHMTAAFNYYEVDVDYDQKLRNTDLNVASYNLYYSFIGPMLSVSYRF